jgi:hypothetical protein
MRCTVGLRKCGILPVPAQLCPQLPRKAAKPTVALAHLNPQPESPTDPIDALSTRSINSGLSSRRCTACSCGTADYLLLSELTRNLDSYRFNTYFTVVLDEETTDPSLESGYLKLGPLWDMDLGFANIGDGCNDVPGDNMYHITTSPQGWHYQRNMLWQFPDVTLWCAQHSTAWRGCAHAVPCGSARLTEWATHLGCCYVCQRTAATALRCRTISHCAAVARMKGYTHRRS